MYLLIEPSELLGQSANTALARTPTHYYIRSSALAELYTIGHFPGEKTLAFVMRVHGLLAAIVSVPYAACFLFIPIFGIV